MDNEIEIWKDVGVYDGIDYTGMYEVSTFGNFKSLDRVIIYKNGQKRFRKGEIKDPKPSGSGYKAVTLSKNGTGTTVLLHRLILETFVPNPNPKIYTDVNHIDENKTNNRLENLEWTTHKENMNHGTLCQRVSEKAGTAVVQLSKDGILLKQWPSIRSVVNSGEIKTIKKLRKDEIVYNGYIWLSLSKYKTMTKEDILGAVSKENDSKCIIQLNLDGDYIKEWKSIYEIGESVERFSMKIISRAMMRKTYVYKDFLWLNKLDYLNCSKLDIDNIVKECNNVRNKNRIHNKRAIVQLDKNGFVINQWDTIKQATNELNISEAGISNIAKTNSKNKFGIILMFADDYNKLSNSEIIRIVNKKTSGNKNFKKVIQTKLNGEFVKEWNSIKEAANELCINAGNISSCLKGRYSQTGGFKWVYSKDYYNQ
jgi:hypothetical protein